MGGTSNIHICLECPYVLTLSVTRKKEFRQFFWEAVNLIKCYIFWMRFGSQMIDMYLTYLVRKTQIGKIYSEER